MNQNPDDRNTCEVCEQPFSSEQELPTHKNDVHGKADPERGNRTTTSNKISRRNERSPNAERVPA